MTAPLMPRSTKDLTNREGLTWVQWLAAVGLEPGQMIAQSELHRLSVAWEVGEDPADHRKRIDHNKWRESQRRGETTEEHVGRLVCRSCGNFELLKFKLIETIEVQHQVLEIVGGKIQVNKHRKLPGDAPWAKGMAFECYSDRGEGGVCLYRTPVPDWVQKQLDWVD